MKKLIIFILFSIVSFFSFSQITFSQDDFVKNGLNIWLEGKGTNIVKDEDGKKLQECARKVWKSLPEDEQKKLAKNLCKGADKCKKDPTTWVKAMINDKKAGPITYAVYSYNSKSKQKILGETKEKIQKFLNNIYLIAWPLLIVGGKFLSNEFVYGASFGIDNVLWQLWQTIRTFTNYILGIIFILSIFVYFFKSESNFSWKKILPKIVIASIVVNASWFLLGALIDLSTILTVAAGSIGSSFTKVLDKGGKKIENDTMINPIVIDTDNKTGGFIGIKGKDKNYFQCVYTGGNLINAPCLSSVFGKKQIINKNGEKIEIDGMIKTSDIDYNSVGQLVSLFRFMNTSFLTDNTSSSESNVVLFILRIFILIILIIPFILLSVIFVIRVLVLWVVIPLSPALLGAYILGIGGSKVKENLSNIISLILQPAYVVFMLSLGFIMIQAVYTMMPNNKNETNLATTFGINSSTTTHICGYVVNSIDIGNGIIQSKYNFSKGGTTKMDDFKNIFSFFSWILVNLLAGFVLWMLVFTALKSNKFTKKISESVETYATKTVKTIPILPGGQSVASLEKVGHGIMDIPGQKAQSQKTELTKDVEKIIKNDNKNSK